MIAHLYQMLISSDFNKKKYLRKSGFLVKVTLCTFNSMTSEGILHTKKKWRLNLISIY